MHPRVLLVILPLLLAACGGNAATPSTAGTIEFGMAQRNHVIQHPTTSFGPNDALAYVAHIRTPRPIPAHERITEYFFTRSSDGKEHTVMSDNFRLGVTVTRFVTLNSIQVSSLYQVGFHAPGTYHVRLVHGHDRLAEGIFSLR